MTQQQPKLKQLKDKAIAYARQLGLKLTTTKHFKKHVGKGLDLRTKAGWVTLIEHLQSLSNGVVVSLLSRQLVVA